MEYGHYGGILKSLFFWSERSSSARRGSARRSSTFVRRHQISRGVVAGINFGRRHQIHREGRGGEYEWAATTRSTIAGVGSWWEHL
ncbi:hypothetical protein GUJ93_ZPchr0006g44763 [Zizania palustris]|uniref:Uncharacterized protein n=1 Tax=Zizania palustris TaxID=103762 RepID=A0A8J5SSS2_ZIZPA|nr:hypothetical protein GUJ93_ZPchr0006g44763 [Zizania palustris]